MITRERYKRLLKFASSAVILFVEIALYWFVWVDYLNTIIENPFFRKGNWMIVTLYGALLLFFALTYGGLKIGYLRRGNLIYSNIIAIFWVNVLSYCQLALIDKRFHNPLPFVLLSAVDIICVTVWVFVFQWIYEKVFPPKHLLLVYGERGVSSIARKINSRDDKYIIKGAVNINKGIDKVIEETGKYEGVIIGDLHSFERNLILKRCYDRSIRVYMIPKITDILIRSSEELNLFDTPILLSKNMGPQVDQLIIKRAVDIVFSGIIFILTIPLFLIIGIAIKLESEGNIFYTQKRLTKGGEIFDILKFRTMVSDAEKDGKARLSTKSDSRVTKVGKLLRLTRLDELPQLINILYGQMSLVGPRPERPEIAAQYEKEIPEFTMRLKMKAGLTGYAQVHGKYNTTPYDKLKLDLTYIRNYSLWMDFKLILMTPKVLFMKDSTEGIDNGLTIAGLGEKELKAEVYGKPEEFEDELSN